MWYDYSSDVNEIKKSYKCKTTISAMERSVNVINDLIEPIKITNDIKDVEQYLSKYGTFCDKYNFYIADDGLFYSLSHKQQLMVFLTDIFYAFQDCTKIYSGEKVERSLQGHAMLLLYFFGFYGDTIRILFMQKVRSQILNKLSEKYDLTQYFVPHPFNIKAYEYILKETIKKDKNFIKKEENTYFGKKLTVYKNYLFVWERCLELCHGKSWEKYLSDDIVTIYVDNDYARINANSTIGKTVQDQLKIVEKLTEKN